MNERDFDIFSLNKKANTISSNLANRLSSLLNKCHDKKLNRVSSKL